MVEGSISLPSTHVTCVSDKRDRREYWSKYYAENKERYVARDAARPPEYWANKRKQYRDRVRPVLNEIKDQPCADCGFRYPYPVMEFDHVRGEKVDNVSAMVSRGVGLKKILAEVEKCDIVCANCHRIRTWERSEEATAIDT